MNRLSLRKYFLLLILLLLSISSCRTLFFHRNASRNAEKELFGNTNRNEKGLKEPGYMRRAKRKQEAKEKKQNKDYERVIKESKKRSFDIQTDEVKKRMKQDRKITSAREKAKKRKEKKDTRKAAQKYD